MKIAWVDLNKGNSGGWFDARAVFEDKLPGNCQIVHYGEVEKTRHHDEGAMWRFYSVARNPMKKKQGDPRRKKQSGFGITIAKTRGACVIAIFWRYKEMGRDQDGLGGCTCDALLDRPCARIWAKLPVYLCIIVDYVSV